MNCGKNEHTKRTLQFLSGAIQPEDTAGARSHLSDCPDCKNLFELDMKAENWFADMRETEAPAWLEARVRAQLRPAGFSVRNILRILAPAGAVTALTLGVWLWLASGPDAMYHPVDELMFNHEDSITASAVADDEQELVSFLRMDAEEDML
ncbi:MAG: hypothetical protein PHP45_03035 [Elusimicrobiales bacterium]|nr:hypothetical protein [Elusimicrobiales bacterium]